jgi:hypothetical protein
MFKCEHGFKKCEYTDSQRMIHTAVGPEFQKKKKRKEKKIITEIHITAVSHSILQIIRIIKIHGTLKFQVSPDTMVISAHIHSEMSAQYQTSAKPIRLVEEVY